jgi:hypothetical protein
MGQEEMEMWEGYAVVSRILESRGMITENGFYLFIPREKKKIVLTQLMQGGLRERTVSATVADMVKDPAGTAELLTLQLTFS